MKRGSNNNTGYLQVDPITGEYYVIIPEWAVNDLCWYEDTEIEIDIESNELVLKEKAEIVKASEIQ
mgnify:CR=1 FL=1